MPHFAVAVVEMWARRKPCPSAASYPQPCHPFHICCLRATPPSGCDSPAPRVAAYYCTTRLKNTHGTQFRELLYRWHPWHGLRVGVYEAIEKPDGVVFRCALAASDSVRCLEIPAWMFDRSACARGHVAAEPRVDLSALAMLTALLLDVRNNWPAAWVAPDSGVSPLSGDQNRREPYAMPQQMEDGTPPRAAADRPVRKGSAGERRHARLGGVQDFRKLDCAQSAPVPCLSGL